MKSRFFFVAALVLVSCGSKKTSTTPSADTNKVDTSTVKENVVKDEVLCFELKETIKQKGGDMNMTTFIQLTMSGDNVTGVYEEDRTVGAVSTDGAAGDYKGTKVGDTLKLDLTFTIEGSTQIEETIYLLQVDKLMQKEGAMEEKEGKLVIKDQAKAKFSKTYSKITCN